MAALGLRGYEETRKNRDDRDGHEDPIRFLQVAFFSSSKRRFGSRAAPLEPQTQIRKPSIHAEAAPSSSCSAIFEFQSAHRGGTLDNWMIARRVRSPSRRSGDSNPNGRNAGGPESLTAVPDASLASQARCRGLESHRPRTRKPRKCEAVVVSRQDNGSNGEGAHAPRRLRIRPGSSARPRTPRRRVSARTSPRHSPRGRASHRRRWLPHARAPS